MWCAVIERDKLGDNLVPDMITRVAWFGFYGWPWYYSGPTEQPTLAGKRPDLRPYVKAAETLIQPHSSPLGITFYTGSQFPAQYRNDAFVTLHGSWNRSGRTGYKAATVPVENGRGTGGPGLPDRLRRRPGPGVGPAGGNCLLSPATARC